jgi:hypothetical protein
MTEHGQPTATAAGTVLAEPAARVRAVLDDIFGPLTVIATAFATRRSASRAAGGDLTPDRLSGLREIIWQQLGRLPAADGAGIVAAPGVVAGRDRHLEWWQRTGSAEGSPEGYARIRLNLDPESIDLYDYLEMDWFTVPRGEGRPYVYGPYIDFSGADRYVLTMTLPVLDDGEFLGVAGADLRMSHLEPELLAILRSVPAAAVLVTAERRVVAANSARWIAGTRVPRPPVPGDGEFAAVTEIGTDSGWRLAVAADAPTSAAGEYGADGQGGVHRDQAQLIPGHAEVSPVDADHGLQPDLAVTRDGHGGIEGQ